MKHTPQSWYDEIVRRLKANLFPATAAKTGDNLSDCAYRSENKQCFAGILIADEDYDPKFEGKLPSDQITDDPRVVSLTAAISKGAPENASMACVRTIQSIHDDNVKFGTTSKSWNLETKKLILVKVNSIFEAWFKGVVLIDPETLTD